MRLANIVRSITCSAVARLPGRIKKEAGGSIVETALAMPVLLAMLVGAAEFGMAAYSAIEVSNAAMAGVQYGAQSASASGDVTGIQTAAANDAPNITLGTTNVSHTCICSDGSASTCQSTDCSASHIETILTVQTQTTFNPGLHLPGLPMSFTIHGQAVQKVMQ